MKDKVVVISNRYYLGRCLNICVNIVKNSLNAMSRNVKLHLDLLSDDTIHKISPFRSCHLATNLVLLNLVKIFHLDVQASYVIVGYNHHLN